MGGASKIKRLRDYPPKPKFAKAIAVSISKYEITPLAIGFLDIPSWLRWSNQQEQNKLTTIKIIKIALVFSEKERKFTLYKDC